MKRKILFIYLSGAVLDIIFHLATIKDWKGEYGVSSIIFNLLTVVLCTTLLFAVLDKIKLICLHKTRNLTLFCQTMFCISLPKILLYYLINYHYNDITCVTRDSHGVVIAIDYIWWCDVFVFTLISYIIIITYYVIIYIYKRNKNIFKQ